jgi:hypothetical protein
MPGVPHGTLRLAPQLDKLKRLSVVQTSGNRVTIAAPGLLRELAAGNPSPVP